MSSINIINVQVLNNPSTFLSNVAFKITFESIAQLPHDLEWKLIYVGSAKDESKDQILDCIEIEVEGPGIMEFVFEGPAPKPELIPSDQLLKLTAIMITVAYQEKEFFRLGYYVHYQHPQVPEDCRLEDIKLELVERHIIADKPRITKTQINWSDTQVKSQQKDSTEDFSHSFSKQSE